MTSEAVAWRFKFAASPSWSYRDDPPGPEWMEQCRNLDPLYTAPPPVTGEGVREAIREWLRPYGQEYREPHDRLCDLILAALTHPAGGEG